MSENRLIPLFDFRSTTPVAGTPGHAVSRAKQNNLAPEKFIEYERLFNQIASLLGDVTFPISHRTILPADANPDNIGSAINLLWTNLNVRVSALAERVVLSSRGCVVRCLMTDGLPAFLVTDGARNVSIAASIAEPLIMSFSAGYLEGAPLDYVKTLEDPVAAWIDLPLSSTLYLTVEWDTSTAMLVYDYTEHVPTRGRAFPAAPAAGDYHYHTIAESMYYYTGTDWEACTVLFLGRATLDGTEITELFSFVRDAGRFSTADDGSLIIERMFDGETATVRPQLILTDATPAGENAGALVAVGGIGVGSVHSVGPVHVGSLLVDGSGEFEDDVRVRGSVYIGSGEEALVPSGEGIGITAQLRSSVTDRAPLEVQSTYLTENLNADLLDGQHATDIVAPAISRIETNELRLLDHELRLSYIEGRQYTNAEMIIETFTSPEQRSLDESAGILQADVLDDCDWNNNWKERPGAPAFKAGFARNRRQKHVLENFTEYDLTNVGQTYKNGLAYDATNRCYWLLTSAGGVNSIGEILLLTESMLDGRVEVTGRWYLPAVASRYWSGMASDGDNLYFVSCYAISSVIYQLPINDDGTLGAEGYEKTSGSIIDIAHTTAFTDNTAGHYINDVASYSDTEIAYLTGNGPQWTIGFLATATMTAGTTTSITGVGTWIGGTTTFNRSFWYQSGVFYLRVDNATDNVRHIYRIVASTDVVSGVLVKHSGRFSLTHDVAGDSFGGLCIGHHGDLLEIVSTASYGRFISRRSITGALWAENQVCGGRKANSATTANLPNACMVENDRYLWTADQNVGANAVDVYRYDTQSADYWHIRLTGQSWTTLWDMAYNPTTDVLYLLGSDGTNYEVIFGDLSTFVAAMELNACNDATTLALTIDGSGWGTIASGIGNSHTKVKYGMCYDSDNDILYIINDSDDCIDSLSIDGTTYTTPKYDLPAPYAYWVGIAARNGYIYVGDYANTARIPNFIYEIPVAKANTTKMYRSHIYQDSSRTFQANGRVGFDFLGDDIVQLDRTNNVFTFSRTLHDPDALQLHTFLDEYSGLLNSSMSAQTAITRRYHQPSEFADQRDCPDPEFMVVGYVSEGISILHLTEFLSDQSDTGKQRYDVTKIRFDHYKRSATANGVACNIIRCDGGVRSIVVDRDIIVVGTVYSSYSDSLFIIDLKEGTAQHLGTTYYPGAKYLGSLSQRNDAMGYNTVSDTSLSLSAGNINSLQLRTFTNDDISDYPYEYPTTYVLVSTEASGVDLLTIEEDSTGRRALSRVYKNIFGSGHESAGRYAAHLAKSGKIFSVYWDANGQVFTPVLGDNAQIVSPFVWEIRNQTKTWAELTTSATYLAGYGCEISANSPCWKTPSGWRHRLLVGTLDDGSDNGNATVVFYDVERNTLERAYLWNSRYQEVTTLDTFEDLVFAEEGDHTNTSFNMILLLRRSYFSASPCLRFSSSGSDTVGGGATYANWTTIDRSTNSRTSAPRFAYAASSSLVTGGSAHPYGVNRAKFSPEFGIAAICDRRAGLQLFHLPHIDECVYTSIAFETPDAPTAIVYRESALVPEELA